MNYDHHDEEDNVLASKDPQVTSLDPEERKAARALRIKRRQDALKLKDLPPEEVVATIQELTPIEQATTEAAIELQKLNWDGAAKVTNVKVTTDEREVERRGALFVKMQQAFRKIEEEAANAQIQYDAITSNWGPMLQIKDPLDIDAAIKEQKVDCDKLLAQKDQLISELKDDLKKVDSAYYMDLKKQDKEIKELSERVEKQTTIMQKAYEKQLALIEKAINIEREAMLDYNNKRWEALNRQRDKEEVAHIDYKFDQLEEHKLNLEEIMWDHCEKYREAKVELETLIQDLQRDLEKLKATCNINTEKIGYTYQVLRKREEENVFVRSQQKRKLNKMSDVANGLRMKIRKAAEEGAAEEIRADAEIVTLMKTMEDFEHKSYHFSRVNDDKFRQVWQMCENQCKSLLKEVRQAEVAIHAHILAEAAPPPLVAPKSILKPDQEESTKGDTGSTHEDEKDAKEKLIEHLLKLVADNTGFLIEDRLIKLIEKKTKTSQKLCTIDSIFMALEIQSAEDIELLLNIFLKYAFCPVCSCFDVDSELYQSMNEPDAVEFVEGRNRKSKLSLTSCVIKHV